MTKQEEKFLSDIGGKWPQAVFLRQLVDSSLDMVRAAKFTPVDEAQRVSVEDRIIDGATLYRAAGEIMSIAIALLGNADVMPFIKSGSKKYIEAAKQAK